MSSYEKIAELKKPAKGVIIGGILDETKCE